MTRRAALSLLDAAAGLRAGRWRADQLEADVRARIAERADDHCYSWLNGEARPAFDPEGSALSGLGYALKSNIASRGHPTDCGSRMLRDWRAPFDATVVERLQRAGAHILGKTGMDEFGMGSSSEHSAFGAIANPWSADHVPGGSSGGSASAVASGQAFFALGSDTGGSVRQPAHCCGVVGLKPTWGRISRYGLVAFASSLDQIGPITRTVADNAAVYAAIAGPDERDSTSRLAPVGDPVAALQRPAEGFRVGVAADLSGEWLGGEDLDADVATLLETAEEDLRRAGVTIRPVTMPSLRYALAAYYVIAAAEASANLARYDGSLYGKPDPEAESYALAAADLRTRDFGEEVRLRILLGTYVLSEGYAARAYRRAVQARALIAADFAAAFADCDAILVPTMNGAAFNFGERLDDRLRMYRSDLLTVPASLAGVPAISLPGGLDRQGLPLGLQLIGPALGEETLYTLAASIESQRGFSELEAAPWNS